MPKVLPVYIIAAIAAVVAMYAGFAGRPVWFIHDTRTAVITLAAAGFLMCSTGAIASFVSRAPAHPLTIAGYLVGALALLAGLTQLFGWKVPYLADARTALIVITVAVVIKVIIARLANFVVK
jgi:hypothetical protein